MTRAPRLTALALLAACGVVAGCGSSDKTKTTTAPPKTRTVTRTVVDSSPDVAGATATTTIPGSDTTVSSIGSTDSTGIIRPFAANSPWNTPIQSVSRDPKSDQMMRLARERVGVTESTDVASSGTRRHFLNDPLFINLHRWTDPVVDETDGVQTPIFCRQPAFPPLPDGSRALCGDGWSVSSLMIPAGDDPHPEFDGWYTVLNRRSGVAYDLWRARRATDGQSMSYQFMRSWDLNGPGFLAPNNVSARGSGLPLFGGLILPEEIQAGRIDHALAIAVPAPAQRRYVQPASSTDGIGDTNSLPEGARIRLKAGVTLRSILRRTADPRCSDPLYGLRTDNRAKLCQPYRFPGRTNKVAAAAIITALHRYGAIVVDRARVPTLYGKFNGNWNDPMRDDNGHLLDANGLPFKAGQTHLRTPLLRGNEVQGLRLSDFEVAQLGPTYRYPSATTVNAVPLPGGAVGQTPRSAGRTSRGRRATRQTFQPAAGGG